MPPMADHWTTRVFVKHAPLYGQVLAALNPRAAREVRSILRILNREGVPEGGRVLDIACGVGRHVIPMAKLGYRAVGCDISQGFIEQARKSARETGLNESRLRFYKTDYRRIDKVLRHAHERPFDAAVSIFTSMGYYGESGDFAVLRAVRRVVRPGGIFVVEMGNRDWVLHNFEPMGVSRATPDITIRERRCLDWKHSVVHSVWEFYRGRGSRKRKVFRQEIAVRLYSLHELRSLFERAGWTYVRSYGNLTTLQPVSLRSHQLVVLGRRPTSRSRHASVARVAR